MQIDDINPSKIDFNLEIIMIDQWTNDDKIILDLNSGQQLFEIASSSSALEIYSFDTYGDGYTANSVLFFSPVCDLAPPCPLFFFRIR